jgi:hypothetical protein
MDHKFQSLLDSVLYLLYEYYIIFRVKYQVNFEKFSFTQCYLFVLRVEYCVLRAEYKYPHV